MYFRRYGFILVMFTFLCLIFTGCSNQTNTDSKENETNANDQTDETSNEPTEQNTDEDPEEKVKITIAYQWGEDAFNKRYRPIEEYLGNVEIEFVASTNTLQGFEEMFAAGIKPDIIVDQNIFALQDLDVIYPLDDLLEQSGFDVGIFDQPLLDSLRAYDDEGRTIGLPDGTSVIGLYYNKDVFDLFGIDYPDPEKPMTWQEVLDLARKMTVERDGVQYIGLDGMSRFALQQFAPTATNPETGEVLINEREAYKRYFDLVAEFYNIPGMREEESLGTNFVEKRAAMTLATNVALNWIGGDDVESLDLVPFPVWPDQPTIGPLMGTTPMVITNYSENKEVALEILKAYFLPEILTEHVRTGGTVPPIADEELLKQYAVDLEIYNGKNLAAYYVLDRVTREEPVSRWDDFVDLASAETAIKEGKDVVTVLRELEEESTAKIQEAMAGK
ncbi:ABC transporter substrate-binding protein [Bacillus niameyensis]|uniref:ABC transporter substrate-binding protein n=1 Tax=Bacillus niameyensis TaxID=1522308 RepID=UPI000781BC9A|nr:extracellular solute-binding protein [Bacillus niameyensis]